MFHKNADKNKIKRNENGKEVKCNEEQKKIEEYKK